MTPGREVAGAVEAVGPGVDEAWIGQHVVVHLGMASGGYAERVVAEVTALHPLADGIDLRRCGRDGGHGTHGHGHPRCGRYQAR